MIKRVLLVLLISTLCLEAQPLPSQLATTSAPGIVQPDGSTITIVGGVISSTGVGGGVAVSGGKGINNVFTNATIVNPVIQSNQVTVIHAQTQTSYPLLSTAVGNAVTGDIVEQYPGTYVEPPTSFITFPKGVIWNAHSGAVTIFQPTNGNNGANALINPSDNCRFYNPYVLVSNTPGQFYTPFGAGLNNVGFTNVYIYNAYVTNDVDGYFISSPTNCQWVLDNCKAVTSFDCYNQVTVAHQALLINPIFTVTNTTSTASAGQTRRCIANGGGNVTIVGGFLTIADPPNDTNYSAAIAQTVSGSTNFINGTWIDSRGMTNVNSSDIFCTFAQGSWGTAYRVDGKMLQLRAPINGATARLLFPSYGVNAGSVTNPSIYTIAGTGTNGGGYGLWFPGQTNIAVAIATNEILRVDAAGLRFKTNSIVPGAVTVGDGELVNSNQVLWWVTATSTNKLAGP